MQEWVKIMTTVQCGPLWREADVGDRTQRHAWSGKHTNLVDADFSLVFRSGMLRDG